MKITEAPIAMPVDNETLASRLTYGEVCAGVGGLSMAIEELFEAAPLWHVEWDEAPRKVLEARWPQTLLYDDVTRLDWDTMPRVDVLGGGYPCQPFSLAGKRKAEKDDRHLWPYIAQGVSILKPTYVMFENVYGHLSKGLSDVLLDLNNLGYVVSWGVQKASDVGAPHERKRVFILGKYAPDVEHVVFSVTPLVRGTKMPPNGLAIEGGYVTQDALEDGTEVTKLFLTPCAAEGTKGTPQVTRLKELNGQRWLSNAVMDVAEVNAH